MKKILTTIFIIALLLPTLALGAQTHSLDLESGSSQYASITDGSQTGLDITGDITVESWVKLESQPSDANYTIASKYRSDNNQRSWTWSYRDSSGTKGIRLIYSTNGQGGGGNADDVQINYTLSSGVWHHLAFTLDVSTGEYEVFVNGDSAGSTTGDNLTLHNSSEAFAVGAINTGGTATNFFDGLVKDVRVFDDIRTASEIASDAHAESVSNANLQGEWNFNNAYTDASGNGNDLTATNSPVFSTDIPWEKPSEVEDSTYLETNLQGYWTLDEASGTRVDSTSNGNDLTDNNTVGSATGKHGNGGDFEKSNTEYLSIADGDQTGLDSTGGALSFSCWLKVETAPSSNNFGIVSKQQNTGVDRTFWLFYRHTGGVLRFDFDTSNDTTPSTAQVRTVEHDIGTGTFVHMVATYSMDNGDYFNLYIDGVLVGRATASWSGTLNTSTADFVIGALDEGDGDSFDGVIDECAFYDRELHYGDVLDLYNGGSGITFSAPLGPTNLKTLDTVAKASIKTINGTAIASVKTINTVT